MEMESGGEDMAFQEQPIPGDGPDKESAVGCVTEGKKEFCTLRKYQFRTLQNQKPLPVSEVCSAL